MNKRILFGIAAVFLLSGAVYASPGTWERHCQACHDGKTIVDGKVVIDREQLKTKYRTLDEFVTGCGSSPSCMNILKHDKGLLKEAGSEIGLKGAAE